MLQKEIIDSITPAEFAVIVLHGLGASGHDLIPVTQVLGMSSERPIRFVFPHAPLQAITAQDGMVMRAWYDILDFDFNTTAEDAAGLERSRQEVVALIEEQVKAGIPCSRIFLAGFSQGGAIALYAGLRYQEALGGIMALSTYLPLMSRLSQERHVPHQTTPLLLCHGKEDAIVPFTIGEKTRDFLEGEGYAVEWHAYTMGHEICFAELKDTADFLERHQASGGAPSASGGGA